MITKNRPPVKRDRPNHSLKAYLIFPLISVINSHKKSAPEGGFPFGDILTFSFRQMCYHTNKVRWIR